MSHCTNLMASKLINNSITSLMVGLLVWPWHGSSHKLYRPTQKAEICTDSSNSLMFHSQVLGCTIITYFIAGLCVCCRIIHVLQTVGCLRVASCLTVESYISTYNAAWALVFAAESLRVVLPL